MDWENKAIVITGASSGIGKALAERLAEKGTRLILIARNKQRLAKTGREIRKKWGAQPLLIAGDVSKPPDMKKAAEKTKGRFGRIDVLINNAGLGYYGDIEKMDEKHIHEMIDINLKGIIWSIRAFLPLMDKGARIVNVSSIAGKAASPRMEIYAATKFAVNGLSEGLSIELKPKGITVHCFMPGITKTNFTNNPTFPRAPAHQKAARPFAHETLSAEAMADALIHAVEKGRRQAVHPFPDWAFLKFKNAFPNIVHAIHAWRFSRGVKVEEKTMKK